MNDVRRKAEYLFDELGLIDDAIIAEAMSEGISKRKRIPSFQKAVSVAAAAAVVVTLSLGALVVGKLGRLTKQDEDNSMKNEGVTTSQTLSAALIRAEESDRSQSYSNVEEIELFDGVTKIVWKSFVSENYYAIPLDGSLENSKLDRALKSTYNLNENVPLGNVESFKVWVSYGDGSVVSPYLRDSAGNVGYGELFDYSPEIVPSEKLGELIDDLIST